MSSVFPDAVDVIRTDIKPNTPERGIHADLHNQVADAIMQIEELLGIGWSGITPAGSLVNQGNSPYFTDRLGDVLYVVVANDRRVQAYDISGVNAATPKQVAQSAVLGLSSSYIKAFGNYVFIADSADLSIRVLDKTTLALVAGPFAYSAGGTGGGRFDISPDGLHLLVGGPENGPNVNKATLMSINPATGAMVALGQIVTGLTQREPVALSNTLWAIASRDAPAGFKIINAVDPNALTNPSSVVTVGTITTPMERRGNVLYVGCYSGMFETYDLTQTLATAGAVAPTLLDTVVIPTGSEQIVIDSVAQFAYVACRPANTLVKISIINPAALEIDSQYTVAGTVTPGIALDANDEFAYLTCAGDVANGIIYVFSITGDVIGVADALQSQVSSLGLVSALKAAANLFTGTQTISALSALILSNDLAQITFGTTAPFTVRRTAAAALRADVTLTLLSLLVYNAGRALGLKSVEGNAQFNFTIDGDGTVRWGDGVAAPTIRLGLETTTRLRLLVSDFNIGTAGRGLRVAEGANAKQGVATLVGGTILVANTSVTAASRIFLTAQDNNTIGALRVSARVVGTSFTITSSNAGDTGVVAYEIYEPG